MAEEKKKSGLDRRQRDIKVGAGLEEARYNVEFIDALRRWGPTVMLVVAAAAMTFWGIGKWREHGHNKAGVAYGDLDQAMFAGAGVDVNPDVLVQIATDNAGHGAVPLMARLRAAEQWRTSAMKGYRHGGFNQTTRSINQDDYLTESGKADYLKNAKTQYKWVVDAAAGNTAQATFALSGYMGLAAVAETEGKVDEAKAAYKSAQELAEKTHYPEFATLAKARLENVEKFATPVTLPSEAAVLSWDKPKAAVVPSPLLTPSALSGDLGIGSLGTPQLNAPDPLALPPSLTIPSLPDPAPTAPTPPSPSPTPAPAAPEKKDEPKQP